MLLLYVLLPLSSLLHQTLGKDDAPILSDLPEERKQEIIAKINTYRRNVKPTASNMLKMTWSKEAEKTASEWAAKCAVQTSPAVKRTVNGAVCGETLSQSKIAQKWTDIIEIWHRSNIYFKYGVGATDPKKSFLPYTQLVWYLSHKIGCAAAYCPTRSSPFMYVCHFCPGGNLGEQINTPYKEGKPCGDCPKNCEDKLCTNPCKYSDKTSDCKEIMATFTCATRFGRYCEATCKCKTEII